jgi:hypothetical protein
MNCVIKSRRCVRKEGPRKKGYISLTWLLGQHMHGAAVLAELSRIRRTWQNMAECGRIWQIAVNCHRLRQIAVSRSVSNCWWKQVDVYKVSRGYPVPGSKKCNFWCILMPRYH